MQKFGKKLRDLRKKRDLSYRQLASILEVSHSHISGIEAGKHNPSVELMFKIARFFGVSADQLMDDEVELN